MLSRIVNALTLFAGVTFTLSVASFADTSDVVITPKGYGAFEFGQIGHGHYRQGASDFNRPISHVWQQRALANVGFNVRYQDLLELDIVGEGMMAFSTPQLGKEPTTLQPRHSFYIKSSNAKVMLGDPSFLFFEIQAGYFIYKYNSDVRNLGEYLFRSNPYPLVIYADFDYAKTNLLGLRLNFQGFNKLFSNDLLLHSEVVSLPVQNWSISDVAEVNLFKIASFSIGGSLYHFLNVYQGQYMLNSFDRYYYAENLSDDITRTYSDTVLDHSAIKAMARVALDPKQIISLIFRGGEQLPFFNRNDLRLYGEIDLLGFKDYPLYYEDIADRIIYSFGFNIPGLFILDLLNLEFEYCSNQSAYSDENFFGETRPSWIPASNITIGDTLQRAPWRWSAYVKKSFFNDHLSLIAQVARDHKKINFYYFLKSSMSFRETLPAKDDWWWTFKTEFKF